MKFLTAISLISLAATSAPAVADTAYNCPNPSTSWIGGPAHGYNDWFNSACVEPAHPSKGLVIASGPNYSDFDSTVINQFFLHTMNKFPQHIMSATLNIRIKPLQVSLNDNDTIGLYFKNPVTGVADTASLWSRRLGTGGGVPGLRPDAWNTTNYPNGHLFSLDLCALPLDSGATNPNIKSNLIPHMEALKYMDIVVQDDSAVDFVSLEFKTCCGGNGGVIKFYPVTCAQQLAQPQLWCSGCATGGGVIDLGVYQAAPFNFAALFIGLGQGTAPLPGGATLDVLPLIAGPIMIPLDAEGSFELSTPLPAGVAGVTINLQALVVDPPTGKVSSSNGIELTIQ